MTKVDTETILTRIDRLMAALSPGADQSESFAQLQEVVQGMLTLYSALYGPNSAQAAELLRMAKHTRDASNMRSVAVTYSSELRPVLKGALRAMREDVSGGLVGSLTLRGAGEVLADMLGLAKEAIADGSDGAKNVAAVLIAASYEDTVRKLGSELANVTDRTKLQSVFTELKKAKVLEGASHSTGLGFLKFRNDALHAHWDKLDEAVTGSCLAWVEALLQKHFS